MPSRSPLRAATFNLLHGVNLRTGLAVEADLADAAATLAADVVGLQEVDRAQERSGGVDQTAIVAGASEAPHWRFEPALYGTPSLQANQWRAADGAGRGAADGGDAGRDAPGTSGTAGMATGPAYGVGLVSRWPVRQWAVRRFPPAPVGLPLLVAGRPRPRLHRVPDEPRVALLAVLDGPSGPLTVLTAHLSFVPGVNAGQVRAVTRWARNFPAPRLLLGDLNLPGAVPARLTGWRQLGRVATYPSYRPRVQFDHALGDGLDPIAVQGVAALRLAVSDHCALRVDLQV